MTLDLSALNGLAGDWEPRERGVALSPDEREVAVVLWSQELVEYRLALFSTLTGELLTTLENGDAVFFANPVFSTDGSQVAAASATGLGRFLAAGELSVWDRDSLRVEHEVWPWTFEEGNPVEENQLLWDSCTNEVGFSNDGLYIDCGSITANKATDEIIAAYEYEPGFNTLPSGVNSVVGRPVYDPEVTRPARLVVDGSSSEVQIRPIGASQDLLVDLGRSGWPATTVALDGESSLGAVVRTDGSRLRSVVPRFSRPAADLSLIRVDGGTVVETLDLSLRPVTGRFSPSGTTYAMLSSEFALLLFDTE